MRAGLLKESITIQQRSVTRSATGDEVETWTDYLVKRAAVEPLNGKEYFTGRQETAEVNYRIRMRYDSTMDDITPLYRVSYAGRIFDIKSVINRMERNREIILMCQERVLP